MDFEQGNPRSDLLNPEDLRFLMPSRRRPGGRGPTAVHAGAGAGP